MEWRIHFVTNDGSAVAFHKFVFMPPEPIRAASLFIDEAMRRFPRGNFTLPTHRETTDAETIVNERTDMHLERPRAENLEFKPRRREHFKVGCIREKRKDFSDRLREPKFAFQLANFHAGLGLVERRKSSSWLQNSSMLSVNKAPIRMRVSR